jgi:hypothetical protein
MPSHMTTLGFRAATNEEFADLAMTAATQGEPVQVSGGAYYRWTPGAGVELWAQVDQSGQLIGLNPHFGGAAHMMVGLIKPIARERDSALDGAFYGWADPAENEPDNGQYPFAFDLPDFKRHDRLALPAIVSVQIAAFAHSLSAFESDEVVQSGETHMIPHLSCWENQTEGVDEGAEGGKTGLDRLHMRERHEVEPR